MTNKNQPVKIQELVKPDISLQGKHQAEAESLCEGYSVSCESGFAWTCSGTFSSATEDHDIIF